MERVSNPVLEFLAYGDENAVSREYLSSVMGMNDRAVRKLIELARDDGVNIVNAGDGRGYYISDDLDDLERQYRVDRARALSVLKRLSGMRRTLKEAGRNV